MKLNNSKLIWKILTKQEKKIGLLLLVFMLVSMLMETLGIGLIVPALGLISNPTIFKSSILLNNIIVFLEIKNNSQLILYTLGFMLFVYSIKSVFQAYLIWKQTNYSYNLQERLSNSLFEKYMNEEYIFLVNKNSSHLIQNITREVDLFNTVVSSSLNLLSEIFIIVGLIVLLFTNEPTGTFFVISILGLAGFIFHSITKKKILKWGYERQVYEKERLKNLNEGFGGIKDIKLLGRELYFINKFKTSNKESARVGRLQAIIFQIPKLWLELLGIIGLFTIITTMILRGSKPEEIFPILGLFTATAFKLIPSMNKIISALQTIRYGIPVVGSLSKELETNELIDQIQNIPELSINRFTSSLILENITFSYNEKKILNNTELEIKKGDYIGIIGPSGAGKSTLADIILNLLKPQSGKIYFNDIDVLEKKLKLTSTIGYVPQNIFLADASILENIAFGIESTFVDMDRIKASINDSQLNELINSLPEKEFTIIGERGVKLSGGQRQRIGIARALYNNPEILLFDEATSSLDPVTEGEVMKSIQALYGVKTIIIITHRMSTLEKCDKIYKIENGQIIEKIK